ncbi:MAG TPA: cobyric acid synthase, partial [Acidobacteriaceae bacterium]|nr:cobyric acid synthase [Acidobacteriaceae bacterium]
VRESYEWLSARYEAIVLEGAGSPVEINLKSRDIVNMRMAALADAQCILVADIDRGGVFASLLGTFELLEPEERARIRGFIINKFRGDLALLLPGIRQMEERVRKPCLGVVPFLEDLHLEEEDSLGLPILSADWPADRSSSPHRALRRAVVALPSLSNFTDFDPLRAEPTVSLSYCRTPDALRLADVIILPGSKETVKDLHWMRAGGLDRAVLDHHARGGLTVGICGGMQMLGRRILDPGRVESAGSAPGLGLLEMETKLNPQKITTMAHGTIKDARLFGQTCITGRLRGYEIHVGETTYSPGARPFAVLARGGEAGGHAGGVLEDGCVSEDERTFGTYLHGIFDNDAFRHAFLNSARACCSLSSGEPFACLDERKERELDRLAEAVSRSVDIQAIFRWMGLERRSETGVLKELEKG